MVRLDRTEELKKIFNLFEADALCVAATDKIITKDTIVGVTPCKDGCVYYSVVLTDMDNVQKSGLPVICSKESIELQKYFQDNKIKVFQSSMEKDKK